MSVLRFGVFEAGLDSGELRKNGRKVRLQDQPFRVLVLLLQRPGEVVTREELQQKLWGGETFVDFDHSLNMAVKKIRDVLNDSATTPRYVETLPKRGYRFIAPVEGVAVDAGVTRPDSARRTGWYIVATLVAVGVVAGVWFVVRQDEPLAGPLTAVPFTTSRGWEMLPAISPDGTRVAFTADLKGNGNTDIYVKQVGDESPFRLTDHPAREGSATWSPDGTRIAFFRQLSHRTVFEVSALGGSERKLADLPAFKSYVFLRWRALAWSPDERFLAVTNRTSKEDPMRIFMLSRETGKMWPVTPVPSEPGALAHEVFPAFSPDGTRLAFARFRSGGSRANIYVVEISEDGKPESESRQVLKEECFIRGLDWSPDGRDIIFAKTLPGAHSPQLLRVPVSGGEPRPLEVGQRNASNPSISRQGNRLAYEQQRVVTDIWRGPGPSAEAVRKNAAPERWISSTRQDRAPDYSPDGTKIAFASDRTGDMEIWICHSDGSNEVKLTSKGGGISRWSPDGKWIAFMSPQDGDSNIFVMPAEGGVPRRVTSGPEFDAIPSWSRDGRWIYFQTLRGKEGWLIYKAPFEGGEEQRVTQNRGTLALESSDGEDLYFSGEGGHAPGIWRVPTAGGQEVRVIDRPERLFWSVREGGILMRNQKPTPHTLEFYRFDTGQFETFAELPVDTYVSLAVSPDDRHVLYDRTEDDEIDIMLVENFR